MGIYKNMPLFFEDFFPVRHTSSQIRTSDMDFANFQNIGRNKRLGKLVKFSQILGEKPH